MPLTARRTFSSWRTIFHREHKVIVINQLKATPARSVTKIRTTFHLMQERPSLFFIILTASLAFFISLKYVKHHTSLNTIINAWNIRTPDWAQLESCGKSKAPPAHWRHDLVLLLRTAWTRATTSAIVVPQKEGSGHTDPLLTGGRFFRRKYLGAQSNTQVQQKALQGLGFPVLTSLGLLPPNPCK